MKVRMPHDYMNANHPHMKYLGSHMLKPKNFNAGHNTIKSMDVGGGGRFAALKEKIARRSGVTNPAAVAAAIGRKKYGKEQFQEMAAAGHRRWSK